MSFSARFAALLLCFGVCADVALGQSKDLKKKTPAEIREEGKKLFGPDGGGGERPPADMMEGEPSGGTDTKTDAPASAGEAWVIAICLYTGDDHAQTARIACEAVRKEGQLPGAFTQARGKGTLVAVGSYTGPEDPKAKADLDRLHALEINGNKPYSLVWLAPPPTTSKVKIGARPEYELGMARASHGDSALYTLQVGVYGRRDLDKPTEKDLADARKAAEAAAVKLRQEGEEAYYHHGKTMSTVCVGVFDETDFDPQVPSYQSTRLREAKRLHPYNLYNGAAIKVKKKMGDRVVEQVQPSGLVAIPEK